MGAIRAPFGCHYWQQTGEHDMIKSQEPASYSATTTEDETIQHALDILAARFARGTTLACPTDVTDYLKIRLQSLEHEVFGVLTLTNQHEVITMAELFRGTIDGASVYPREVAKHCLADNAAAVVFYHNHPSGLAEPSQADIRITERLKAALQLLDIRVLDHLIIGVDSMSFAERGLI